MTRTAATTGEVKKLESVQDLLRTFANAAAGIYLPPLDKDGNPHLGRFIFDNGRLPFITDEVKPWRYRGWLIPYIQMCERHPLVSPRYDYVIRTLDAGHLLDERLPQIHFSGEFDPAVKAGTAMLKKCLDEVERSMGVWNGMCELCEWLGFALGVTNQPSSLTEKTQEFLYRNFNLEPLLLKPSDYLGGMLSESQYGRRNGFYPTPITVVQFMAAIVGIDIETDQPLLDRRGDLVSDPCVGTGRMLLVASNFSMRLFGQDIDYLCCLITKINLALYAPWFYVPESFFAAADEKPIENLARRENGSQGKEIEQQTTLVSEPETELDRLRAEKHRLDRERERGKRVYTTDVEQPGLF